MIDDIPECNKRRLFWESVIEKTVKNQPHPVLTQKYVPRYIIQDRTLKEQTQQI